MEAKDIEDSKDSKDIKELFKKLVQCTVDVDSKDTNDNLL